MASKNKNPRNYTQNRELSWVRFNTRVLEQGGERDVPLLERLKFVSLFTSNLDEFFMIRVGSFADIASADPNRIVDNKAELTAKEQLSKIYEAVRPQYELKTKIYHQIKEEIKGHGVHPLDYEDLTSREVEYIKDYYKNTIAPILSPQIVDDHHPFPHIPNKQICIALALNHKNKNVVGILPMPTSLPDVIYLPSDEVRYIRTEHVLFQFADKLFRRYDVSEKNIFCVTRNADITVRFDEMEYVGDFKKHMKNLLSKRKSLSVVRLELNFPISNPFRKVLCDYFHIQPHQIFVSATALKMEYIFDLFSKISKEQQKQLIYPPFTPVPALCFDKNCSMIQQIQQKDALLHYPYESMDSFLRLMKEASTDERVVSIKITIYRLAKKAKLVDYLCAAAENGKDVTVILELRARFDEQNNIDWSERLEDAGCKIIYGFSEYKIHSKICLITLKDKNNVRYITQVGTGNFNENTAKLYTDLSLMTANQEVGEDAALFFKNMSIGNIHGEYKHLLVAPVSFKSKLLSLIDEQIALGSQGVINIKLNSFTDIEFIDKLREASRAGVSVRLVVRGICCLVPGIPGETDNINIISIVGRFLEHARIYSFGSGDQRTFYLSSADLMTRNTERRVEVACPILDPALKKVLTEIQESAWKDNVKARVLLRDGSYKHHFISGAAVDSQEEFLKEYATRGRIEAPTIATPPKVASVTEGGFFKKLFRKMFSSSKK